MVIINVINNNIREYFLLTWEEEFNKFKLRARRLCSIIYGAQSISALVKLNKKCPGNRRFPGQSNREASRLGRR